MYIFRYMSVHYEVRASVKEGDLIMLPTQSYVRVGVGGDVEALMRSPEEDETIHKADFHIPEQITAS